MKRFFRQPILCRQQVCWRYQLPCSIASRITHSEAEIQLISTIGFLVGAEVELARLEEENSQLSEELESRKIVERGKGILQRDLRIR